jgi:hypothetical protein
MKTFSILGLALIATLGGCAGDTTGIMTSSVDPKLAPASGSANAKVDPACVSLRSQIDALRKDGVAERVEKASVGKNTTVTVKRESLAKMAELDRANAEFQAKCSTISPAAGQSASSAVPPAAGAANAAASAASGAAASAASTAATKAATAAVATAATKAPAALNKLP